MTANDKFGRNPRQGPQIYSLAGVEPEIHAYAMAKYSRSALSMRQALEEISQQKAEQFLNTFYFQYGHRSIADLAHLSFAIEDVSMLAAIAVVDEQRWDGQERSSRYQDFKASGYYLPRLSESLLGRFVSTIEALFVEYEKLSQAAADHLTDCVPRPSDMSEAAYKRTIRARAFDIGRYLLPLATNTSVGQIVNARTLENQISRLASDAHAEVRQIAALLKESAISPPYNLRLERFKEFVEEIRKENPGVKIPDLGDLLSNLPVAPTLMKYAEARAYDEASRRELSKAATQLLRDVPIAPADPVTLVQPETVEIELCATLIYEHSYHPYRQIVELISGLSSREHQEIISLGLEHRGRYDEVSRSYAAGQTFQFDILMDIGGFRDMHRHRRCTQILQPLTPLHGYSIPEQVEATGRASVFHALIGECHNLWETLNESSDPDVKSSGDYVLPLAFRRRALFKMDLAEAIYICELRTGSAGHFSYRGIAYDMYEALKKLCPGIAAHIRVEDVRKSSDLLRR
jgi:thymidylate synthase ThyX